MAGHHILKRKKYIHLIAAPENIVPLCVNHHVGEAMVCPHPKDGRKDKADRFTRLLLERMPRRMEKLERIKAGGKKHDFQSDMRFWQMAWTHNIDYELVCEKRKIEAWL